MVIKAGVLNLYHVDIRGSGTPFVQSLTSYICSVASAHRRSPMALIRAISRYAGTSLEDMAGHLADTDGAIINGYGVTQTRVLTALSRATGRLDLKQLCLGQLGPSFAPKGGRAVKIHRHWCPQCYKDMRFSEIKAYDLLLSQMPELQICAQHGTPLQCRCYKCGAHQLTFPANCALDICGACGDWLGTEIGSQTARIPSYAAYQQWLVEELKQLLIARDEIAPLLSGWEFTKFFRELIRVRELPSEEVARQVNIPVDSLRQWINGRNRPTVTSFLRACANLCVSPANILLNPELAAHQLSFPFTAPIIYRASRGAPSKRHDRERIRSAIAEQLSMKMPTVRGVKELAKRIDTPIGMMYFYDPHGCKQLTRKVRNLAARKRDNKRRALVRSAQRLLSRLDGEGQPLTRRLFVARLTENAKCSVRVAKNHFPVALQRYRQARAELADATSPDDASTEYLRLPSATN